MSLLEHLCLLRLVRHARRSEAADDAEKRRLDVVVHRTFHFVSQNSLGKLVIDCHLCWIDGAGSHTQQPRHRRLQQKDEITI